MYSSWFEPHPFDIARSLRLIEYAASLDEYIYDIPQIIEYIRVNLEERNQLGRVASWAMSMHVLFPLAAAEYGMMWTNGEVPQEGIDILALEKIITNIIFEYTNLQQNVLLTHFTENGVTYENHILILPDYLIY